jgi:hypothetical protein
MQSKIAIAQAKPGWTSKLADRLQGLEGLLRPAPSCGRIGYTCQCIAHGIQIRTDIEAKVFEIIPGIDDDRQAFGRDNLGQAVHQFGTAYATGQGDNVQRHQGISQSGTQGKKQSVNKVIRQQGNSG